MIGFVVIGTGRSGTMYCSKIAQAAGLDCLHEKRIASFTHFEALRTYSEEQGEVSWLALRHLDALLAEGVRIIHVSRHPVDVVSSMYHTHYWTQNTRNVTAGLKISRHLGWEMNREHTLRDPMEWWWRVNQLLYRVAGVCRIEDADPMDLVRTMAGPGRTFTGEQIAAVYRVPLNVNTYQTQRINPVGMTKVPCYERLIEVSERIGYTDLEHP